jgi:DNA (cytosine-5)-methyltransferase 1
VAKVKLQSIRAMDLFAGAGGSSCGARMAGVQVVAAVDVWPLAEKTYSDNFKGVKFYNRKCERLSPQKIKREVGSIQLLIASPECTSHTCAKGRAERSETSRMTAFHVIRFARLFRPRWIVVENVIHMRSWSRYQEWCDKLVKLGYNIREQILNSADFGVPQSRKRLFVICDLKNVPPEIVPPSGLKIFKASDIIDTNGTYRYSALKAGKRAKPTLQRAKRAISTIGSKKPFLLVYYGTDGAGGWQKVNIPLRTITTVDRFAYIRPSQDGHEMRM